MCYLWFINLQDVITEPFVLLDEEEDAEVSRALSNSCRYNLFKLPFVFRLIQLSILHFLCMFLTDLFRRRKVLAKHENSNIDITGEILQCLSPGAWLNDEVILYVSY